MLAIPDRLQWKRKRGPSLLRTRHHIGIYHHELLAVTVHLRQQPVVAAHGREAFRVQIFDPVPLLQRRPLLDIAVREDSYPRHDRKQESPQKRGFSRANSTSCVRNGSSVRCVR